MSSLPRPSSLYRAALCPASFRREQAVPSDLDQSDTTAADEGTRLHLLIAKGLQFGEPAPDPEDAEIVERCCTYYHDTVDAEEGDNDTEVAVDVVDTAGAVLAQPGHVDALWVGEDEAHLFDWKTGRSLWSRPAARDFQLLAYAVGVHAATGADVVHVHRVHPRLTGEYFATSAAYAPPWEAYENVIRKAVRRATEGSGPAVAGPEQCAYCRAKSTCREFQRWAEPPASLAPASSSTLTPARVGEMLAYREKLKMLERAMSDLEQYAMRLIDAGQEIPAPDGGQYVVRERPGNRRIESAVDAASILDDLSMPSILEACSISVGKLEKVVAEHYGLKAREARERLESALDGLITRGNPVRKLEVAQ